MKKKWLFFLPVLTSLVGCTMFNPTKDSTSTNDSVNSEDHPTQTSVNPNSEGLIWAGEETDPELRLLYNSFYDPATDVRMTINIKNEHFNRVCQYGHPDNTTQHDIYSPCNVTINIGGEIREYNEVGIRIKGNMSRNESASSFDGNSFNGHAHLKLSFNTTFEDNPNYSATTPVSTLKARRFGKAKTINLKWNRNNDDEFVRESYASYIMEKEGLLAQKTNNIKVTFVTETSSNEYLYSVQENIDAQFLSKRLKKASQEGDLYKGGWVGGDSVNLCSYNTNLFGVEDCTRNKFYVYDLKTNKNSSNMSNIKNMIKMLNNNDNGKSQAELKAKLDQYIDVDYLMKFMAMEWIIGNPDSLRYHYNNTYFYFSSSNGKMYPIMYDNDRCFGIINEWIVPIRYPSSTKTTMANDMSSTQDNPLYWRTILSGSYNQPVVTEYRNKYFGYVKEYAEKYLNVTAYNTYKNSFHYRDNKSGDNMSFSSYSSDMLSQMNECFTNEGFH